MSQRESGYQRIERDCYETPEWVTRALLPHLGNIKSVWEPAAGSGKIVRVLEAAGLLVLSTDISAGQDFLLADKQSVDAIVTNPPYTSAALFIEHALRLMSGGGKVAMLLRTDFDHAKTRWHLFSGCAAFASRSSSPSASGGSKTLPAHHLSITLGTFGIGGTLASRSLNTICSIEEAVEVEARAT